MNIAGIKSSQPTAQKVPTQQAEDPAIKSLQAQIGELQKQLQQLSKDSSGDEQALAEKRKEIQQQIADLNTQIRQRQVEIRRERQQPKEPQPKAETEKQPKSQGGFSLAGAGNLIAASNTLQQSEAVHGMMVKSQGRANILEAEIATDKARGADTKYKEAELSKVNKGIASAKEMQGELAAKSQDSLKSEKSDTLTEKAEKEEKEDEDNIKTEGKYDKEGKLIEEKDPEKQDYEDKA